MKKILIALLVAVLLLSSCGKKAYNETVPNESDTNETAATESKPTEQKTESETKATETDPSKPTTESDTQAQTETDPPPAEPVFNEEGYTPVAVMYHLIMEEPYNDYEALFVRPSDFSAELDALNEAGYTYLFADEFEKTSSKSVVLTFDDGYEDNYTTMFPILKEHGAKATIFLITDMLDTDGYLTTAQVKEMAQSGYVRFGSHTVSHCDLAKASDENVDYQFASSKETIEALTGYPCNSLAYPAGSYSSSVMDIAANYFGYAYTTKSPNSVTEYSKLNIPRIYAARSLNRDTFMQRIK